MKRLWNAELPIYWQRQKCSPGNVVSGSIRFMQIFVGFPGEGCQMRVWSLKMVIFASVVHCLPLHTWSHDSLYVVRLSMTLAIFQGHYTVSHQISQIRCMIRQKFYRLRIGNHTLAFDWCHFRWPCYNNKKKMTWDYAFITYVYNSRKHVTDNSW